VKRYLVALEAEGDLQQIWHYLLGEAGWQSPIGFRTNWWMRSRA